MDPQQPFSFGWDIHGPAYNDQVQDLLGGPSQPVPGASTFSAPYQIPLQQGVADDLQSDNDVLREGRSEPRGQPAPSDVRTEPGTRSSRPARTESLNWNAHKAVIKDLYISK